MQTNSLENTSIKLPAEINIQGETFSLFQTQKEPIIEIDAHILCVLCTNTSECIASYGEDWWPQTDTCLIYNL